MLLETRVFRERDGRTWELLDLLVYVWQRVYKDVHFSVPSVVVVDCYHDRLDSVL